MFNSLILTQEVILNMELKYLNSKAQNWLSCMRLIRNWRSGKPYVIRNGLNFLMKIKRTVRPSSNTRYWWRSKETIIRKCLLILRRELFKQTWAWLKCTLKTTRMRTRRRQLNTYQRKCTNCMRKEENSARRMIISDSKTRNYKDCLAPRRWSLKSTQHISDQMVVGQLQVWLAKLKNSKIYSSNKDKPLMYPKWWRKTQAWGPWTLSWGRRPSRLKILSKDSSN